MVVRRIIKIFLASPMDVTVERQMFFAVITRINDTIGKNLSCCYDIISWETAVLPDRGDDAQQVVNRQADTEYDVFVALFKDRIGTPTQRAVSGTVEEYERALTCRCRTPELKIMCYFLGKTEMNGQLGALKEKMQADGTLYTELPDDGSFEETVYSHFVQLLLRTVKKEGALPEPTSSKNAVAVAFVTEDDRVLLVKRADRSKYCPGYWQLPGGKIEPGETPIQAAVRETAEELHLCISADELRQLSVFHTCFKNDRSCPMDLYLFICSLDADTRIVLNEENSAFEWLELSVPDLSDRLLMPTHAEMLRVIWHEQSVLGVWDRLLEYCRHTGTDILPRTLPGIAPQKLHSAYTVLSLLGIIKLGNGIRFCSAYGCKLLQALVCAYKSDAVLFCDQISDPVGEYCLPVSEYEVLRKKRENAMFSHEALLSVLSCNIPLPHGVRSVSNVLIFGQRGKELYLLLRWDLFAKKYQIVASGFPADISQDSLVMAAKTVARRFAPGTERFLDLLRVKNFSTYHFAAGSVENDPILRRYDICAANGTVRKRYREDFLNAVRLTNRSTLTVMEYCLNLSEDVRKDLNYFVWCRLDELLENRVLYHGNAVRGIDELLNCIGKTEFLLFSQNAVELDEEDLCSLPEILR